MSRVVTAKKARPARRPAVRGTDIATYRARRDFTVTHEPAPAAPHIGADAPIFVVQQHAARRLHWDFRLEHGGVLWSWAVPKGPSMDPADKRLAVHVEDHPLDYADFQGTIPEGQYGAGTVETWDRGRWAPVGDPEEGLRRGELKFTLDGGRLRGGFVLVRLKPRPKERAENWLLIKEHDEAEQPGADVGPPGTVPGARKGSLPETQSPELATPAEEAPEGEQWLSEVKFDGYRILARLDDGRVQLLTRNGHDWTARMPTIVRAVSRLKAKQALVDGELVALRPDGLSSFADLQAALSDGRDGALFYYLFDLLYLDGWDLRPCRLADRKAALRGLSAWRGALRYSDHIEGAPGTMRRKACAMGLEGIVCKRADSPYRATRGRDWVKVKCKGRDEFVVLGWTPPEGSRAGLGALHLGFHAEDGALHYAGGVGSGFSDAELRRLRRQLDGMKADRPTALLYAGDPPEPRITWVRPELVAEVQYAAWSGAGRLRHATFLGLREDKRPDQVVRAVPDPDAPRRALGSGRVAAPIVTAAKPRRDAPVRRTAVTSQAKGREEVAGVSLSHADRELWPGITKRDLAEYWVAVAPHALPEIAHRPLALVRCPDGIDGEHFFQKHAGRGFPHEIRAGEADGAPYLVIDEEAGLVAAAQMAAIELHAWGAAGADMLHPDRVVFDLDPGEGVGMGDLVRAAKEVRERLKRAGLTGFCRTSGGKGLHVVAPLRPAADWDTTRAWCRAFAEAMEVDSPDEYVASVPKARRRGRILVDWLRNGLGSTAVASFSPRARPGAGVATRLTWREVTDALDPAAFNLRTVPDRLRRQRRDAWDGFAEAAVPLPSGGA